MANQLNVWIERHCAGSLSVEHGLWRFRYDTDWLTFAGRYPLSPFLPLGEHSIDDTPDNHTVAWFFENLLPEGGIRQALAQLARLDVRDSFGLLARFGEESAGALTLLEPGQTPTVGTYLPLPVAELRTWLGDLPKIPLLAAHGHAHMSLAGAQHKLGVHRRPHTSELLLPQGAASSLILKPDNARSQELPFCPANEFLCMQLAGKMGLSVPRTQLLHIPEPIYLVERFDRRQLGDGVGDDIGDSVTRLHQIDLCQLLGKWPGYKYESEGGATSADVMSATSQTRQPAVAKQRLLQWIVFNYLIGNSDAHAKNLAFLVDGAGLDLAPAYDLLSVRTYGVEFDYMAMTIGEEARYGWIERAQWSALAELAGVKPAYVQRLRQGMAEAIVPAAEAIRQSEEFTVDEREFLAGVVAVIAQHVAYVRAS